MFGILLPALSKYLRLDWESLSSIFPIILGFLNKFSGLYSILWERNPPKSQTINILFLLCKSLGSPKYWASKTLQESSNSLPRTTPAFAHLDLGIGIWVLPKDSRTALKSSLSPDTKAPMTFSQIAKVGYIPFVSHLISLINRIA